MTRKQFLAERSVKAQAPAASWWVEASKKSREEWRADASEADKRLNAVSTNYAQPVKTGDE